MAAEVRVAVVPEHFSIPWKLAQFGQTRVRVEDYSRGTGSMCRALRDKTIDVAVALTEGLVADLVQNGPGYRIVTSYVASPLLWAIVGHPELAAGGLTALDAAPVVRVGISRHGSGSHIMSYLLAEQRGWAVSPPSDNPTSGAARIEFVLAGGLEQLLAGLARREFDIFLWETFMMKPHVDEGAVARLGELPSPWGCFQIAVSDELLAARMDAVREIVAAVQAAMDVFALNDGDASVRMISSACRLQLDDARAWLARVRFACRDVSPRLAVDPDSIRLVLATLRRCHVISAAEADTPLSRIIFTDV